MKTRTKIEGLFHPKNPKTGEPMPVRSEIEEHTYKGEKYTTQWDFYWCEERQEEFTTTGIDSINFQRIYRMEAERLADTLVIADFKIYRLVGMAPDDYDEYNYCYTLDPHQKDEFTHVVDLSGFIRLKNHLRDRDYDSLVDEWNWSYKNIHKIRRTDSKVYIVNLVEGAELTLELQGKFFSDRFWVIKTEGNVITAHSHKELNLKKYPEISGIKLEHGTTEV